MITENEDKLLKALNADLNRHDFESHASDLLGMKKDILDHITHLEEWAADSIPDAGFIFGTLGKARIRKEPLGVALIIGAWNFPFILLLQPMLGAIAAGCCIVLKPSELAVASQALLAELIPKYLDNSAIRLITGGPQETSRILEHRFNHIFFTGSSKVARFITAAAAKHLTPTVLELGGQGPAIVTKSANVDLAAKRIAAGKFQNAGQICLSINHVYAEPEIHDQLVQRLGYWFDKYLGESGDGMCKIVNERNFDRLTSLLNQSHGKIAYGGSTDRTKTFIAPTIVTDVTMKDSLLAEELFGPILPVVKTDYKKAHQTISSSEHPLAIYIFTQEEKVADEIMANTNSGGVTINDVIMHAGVPNAPFGGVGESGYGSYHGMYGFLAFSHQRVVLALPTWLDSLLSFRYPPYDINNLAKIAVKNKLGFKPGETMADQKIKSVKGHSLFTKALFAILFVGGATVAIKSLSGDKSVVEESKILWSTILNRSRSLGARY